MNICYYARKHQMHVVAYTVVTMYTITIECYYLLTRLRYVHDNILSKVIKLTSYCRSVIVSGIRNDKTLVSFNVGNSKYTIFKLFSLHFITFFFSFV